ncbi:MAG: hypothetical protein WC716_14170 [Chitinophagaceae bacterium]|jgi:hypothetical protein
MKLESLKSSKFEAFKGSEIVNAMSIKGGQCFTTQLPNTNTDCDTWNKAWSERTYGNGVVITREETDYGKLNDPRCHDISIGSTNLGGGIATDNQTSGIS